MVFTSGATGPHSPVTVRQVLEMTSPQGVDWMLTYQGEPQPGTWMDRFGLLSVIGDAAAASPGWAARIAEQLNARQDWETDLWPILVGGWSLSAATVEAKQVTAIIRELDRHQSAYGILLSVIRLLESLARRQDFLPAVLDEIEDYALKLRGIGLAGDGADAGAGTVNLGTIAGTAINHWAGRLAGFWAQATSTRWQADPDSWRGLPGKTKTALSSLLDTEGFASLAAASVLGANVTFLLGADEPWATGHILPLFDWEADADRAGSAWAGHLTRDQWNPRVVALLWDQFEQSFTRIAREIRPALAVRVASVALYGTADPLDSGLLPKYIRTADEESRQRFASTVDDAFRREPAAFAENQWGRWILRYWRSRLDSIPRPLPAPEAGEMTNWILASGAHLPEAIALATQSPVQIPSSFLFFRRLQESPAIEDTVSAARLITHVLSGAADAGIACAEIGSVIHLLADRQAAGTRQDLLDACSHAATHGCPDALAWQQHVETHVV
jgi:hypothetical protein